MATAFRYLLVDEDGTVTGTDDLEVAAYYEDYCDCIKYDTETTPIKEVEGPDPEE